MRTKRDLRTDLLPRAPIARDAPGTQRARGSHRAEHYYVGRRPRDTEVYVVSRAAIEPLEHHSYRSGSAFDWGAPTPGALELAYAMLAHSTESRPPDPICATFWTEVVACLDRPGFVLAHGEIALWLLTAFCDAEESPPKRRRSLRDGVRRVRSWGRGR
ncbi:MAG: DUF6166 domain-containing protein [Solirubrobacteraceae bacterium]